MWCVVLLRRRVMKLLRRSRRRVKGACHTGFFPLSNRWQICYQKPSSSYLKERWRFSNTRGRSKDVSFSHWWYHKKSNFMAYCNRYHLHFTARWQSRVCHPFIPSFSLLLSLLNYTGRYTIYFHLDLNLLFKSYSFSLSRKAHFLFFSEAIGKAGGTFKKDPALPWLRGHIPPPTHWKGLPNSQRLSLSLYKHSLQVWGKWNRIF